MNNPEDDFHICDKRRAILGSAGHMLVLGGPGSGKTTIALLKARRMVLERLQTGQSVLFLSFSNAAIRRILESAGSVLADDVGRHLVIKTYHSFAWEILQSHGYLLSSKRKLKIVAAQDAAVIQAGLEDDEWHSEEGRLFQEDGLVSYDQFAPRAADLLERSAVILDCFCSAYPLILVDEFQDTDEEQWRLIRALSEHSEIIALGDTEQRIYAWRRGVSSTRLDEFAKTLEAATYDFQNENNRSPATGIAGYARGLLSPGVRLEFPDDITFKRFRPGRFAIGVRIALIETWNQTVKRTGHRDITVAIAARSKAMVRLVSDVLAQKITLGSKEHSPVRHDVMFDQMQITLASRVIAYLLASHRAPRNEQVAGALDRISAVFRCSGNKTGIKTSDRLLRWASKCREGKVPNTKCVNALASCFETVEAVGMSGSPTEDWLLVRRALEQADAAELRRTADHARYLRLLRRGSAIEDQLAELWKKNKSYAGAEVALDNAILQEQLMDSHREISRFSVMTMHQLKGREYDAVILVEDQHRTFRGRDQESPYIETRRLLQVSLTRARHFAYILSAEKDATLDVIFD